MRLNTFWMGGDLGPVERACLRSALRHGHAVTLHCYDKPPGTPDGIELRDAAQTLPQDRVVRHHSGSVALFANLFRYELQRQGQGPWIDTDVYFVDTLPDDRPYLFGWESDDHIAMGVLALPPGSPILPPLIALFDDRTVPAWLPRREKLRAHLRRLATGRARIDLMPWGTAGPKALTALAATHGLTHWALPRHVFYPAHFEDARWVLDPGRSLEQVTQPGTLAVHLWNELIKGFKNEPAPHGSFLARLQDEGA